METRRRGNYDSGDDFVLEYGELRFTFNERDFSERCEQAAMKLGFVGDRLGGAELEDLVNLAVNGEVPDPGSGLGEHVNDCWPQLVGPADRSLVHSLRPRRVLGWVERDDRRLTAVRLGRRGDDGQRAAVDDVARAGEDLAGGVRVHAVEGVEQDDRVAAARRDALGGLHRPLDGLRLRVVRGGEAQRGRGLDRAGRLPLGDLLGAHAGQHYGDVEALVRGEGGREAAQRLALAGPRAAGDHRARAAAERRLELDGGERRVVGAE